MKKRMIALFLLLVLALSLVACNKNTVLTDAEAQQAALEAAGVTAAQASNLHTHFNIVENVPQFEVHFSANGKEYSYIIHGQTGEVLSNGQ